MRFSHGKKTRYVQAHESRPAQTTPPAGELTLPAMSAMSWSRRASSHFWGRFPANQQGAKAREGGGRQAGADDVNKVANGVSTDK